MSLFFELIMETSFGWCDDAAASTVLVMVNSAVQVVFLAVPTKIGGDASWMNVTLLAALLVTVIPLCSTRVQYRRLEIDMDEADKGTVAGRCDRMGC